MRGVIKAKRSLIGALCAAALVLGAGAGPAAAAAPEPDFTISTDLEGPCGLAVDVAGKIYIANYYRHSVDIYRAPPASFRAQISNVDPLNGPCGLGVDRTGALYVNNYHRNVEKFTPSFFPIPEPPLAPPTYTSAGTVDSGDPGDPGRNPTGVDVNVATGDVYVNNRTYIARYGPGGAGPALRIGEGSLGDGYGLAVSQFPGTRGRLYVPDWADNTVKVYDPVVDLDDPVQVIDGSDLPTGGFGSLRDSAVAVDRVSGEVFVADTLVYPQHSEHPQATIYVFRPDGTVEPGRYRLKYNVVDGAPPGLAVDNSVVDPQTLLPAPGRVFVTSGNSLQAFVYAYPPGAATSIAGPASFSLAVSAGGSGSGSIASTPAGIDCDAACGAEFLPHSEIALTATSEAGSVFTGWSGGGCSGTGACVVRMSEARSVSAGFEALSGPPVPSASPSAGASVISQRGTLRVKVSGRLAPKRLPRRGAAPISVSVGGEISTTDQSLPPQLEKLRIELNRNGKLDFEGLPVCRYGGIQPGSSSRALSSCRSALVGKGSFTANITLAGQEPYPTKGKLLVFHGKRGGKPVLYGHIYSAKPFATSFVIVFRVQRLGRGVYGVGLNAPLPKAMDAWGRLTGLEMTLSRRYSHKGRRHSFISAGCPAPKGFPGAVFPLARTSFYFDGGKRLDSTLTSTCKAKG